MSAAARTFIPLWPVLEPRIIAAQPSGHMPKANGNGWIGGIFSPLRQEDRPSFSVKPDSATDPGGFEDHGTGESGSMVELATLMGVDPHVSSSPAAAHAPTLSTFCATRKLDPALLAIDWGVHQVEHKRRPALRYPTALGIDRIKYLDKGPKLEKYIWAGQGGHRHWYGISTALKLPGPLYLVNGEPSVWAAQQEGVAAICLCGGEGAAPTPELVASLLAAGVTEVRVVYDLDDKGRAGAPKTVAALQAGAIDATAYELPSFLGAGGDVDDLHQWAGNALGAALATLPKLGTTPAPAASPAATRRYRTEDEIEQLRPPTWLVKGVVPAGEVTMISGPGDAGKTFIVVDMMKRVTQHYPTMYVALEDAPGIRIRKRAWELHHKTPKNGKFLMWDSPLDLFDTVSVDSFIAEVKPLGLRMITIDTLSRSLGGADENSNTDMAIVMASCERIAHVTGAAVVLIHHTTKDGQAFRGASALKNNTYAHLEVSRDDDLIQLKYGRIKNSKELPSRYFKLVDVPLDIDDEDGKALSSAVILPADHVTRGDKLTGNELRMLTSLAIQTDSVGGAKTTDLADALHLKGDSFYKPLKNLRELGLVDKGPRHTSPLTITKAGRDRLALESADPMYQSTTGTAGVSTPAFEINLRLDEMLLNPLSSNSSSNGASSTVSPDSFSGVATNVDVTNSASQSNATKCYSVATNTPSSNGHNATTTSSPLGGVVSSNSSSEALDDPSCNPQIRIVTEQVQVDRAAYQEALDRGLSQQEAVERAKLPPKESDLSHDKRREAEAETFLAHGDLKAARRAAGHIRGNAERLRVEARIDEAIVVTPGGVS